MVILMRHDVMSAVLHGRMETAEKRKEFVIRFNFITYIHRKDVSLNCHTGLASACVTTVRETLFSIPKQCSIGNMRFRTVSGKWHRLAHSMEPCTVSHYTHPVWSSPW